MKPTTVSTSAASSGFAAAVVVLLVWILKGCNVDVPSDVAVAMGTIIASVTHYIVSLKGETPDPKQ